MGVGLYMSFCVCVCGCRSVYACVFVYVVVFVVVVLVRVFVSFKFIKSDFPPRMALCSITQNNIPSFGIPQEMFSTVGGKREVSGVIGESDCI